jgi:cell division protein FtsL
MREGSLKANVLAVAAIGAAVLSGVALFWTAQRVQTAETKVRQLDEAAASEQQALHVLRAEWDYLNRPDRLEALAKQNLSMTAPQPGEVVASPAAIADPAPEPLQKHRREIQVQPAVMVKPQVAGAQPAFPSATSPQPEAPQPPQAADHRSFQDLMKDLDGRGGTP